MKDFIKKLYSSIAKGKAKNCCGSGPSCCSAPGVSKKMGYTKEDLDYALEQFKRIGKELCRI